MTILVTGGAGFIGSHTVCELLNAGHNVIIVDNLVNSKIETIDYIKEITHKDVKFYKEDILNKDALNKIFDENKIDEVIHFAALKAVGESVEKPIEYYENNIIGTLNLVDVMRKHNVKKIVFSSSATVYGNPKRVPTKETDETGNATNPYGETKVMIERILNDIYVSDHEWSIILLRYFNPIGAHESGLLGELPNGIPNNLMPYINQVALGKLDHLRVFGNDYDTPDGTGVRDYIHVVDLAKGHLKAIERANEITGVETYNLGTGKGYSVLDIVKNFEKANNIKIKYEIVPRRAGDIATCYADPEKAYRILHWKAEKSLEDMCKDSWKFTKMQMEKEKMKKEENNTEKEKNVKEEERAQKEKGVTIIALAVSIIVLIILAGVSIKFGTGAENGVIQEVSNQIETQNKLVKNETSQINSVLLNQEKDWGIR